MGEMERSPLKDADAMTSTASALVPKMLSAANAKNDLDAHAHPIGWRRYVYSTNHKDIGTMYFVLAGMLHAFIRRERGCSKPMGVRRDHARMDLILAAAISSI